MSAVIVTRTNRALNPRAIASGAAGWTSIRGFGTGGAGTYSYVTSPTPPPNGIATVRRKTWTTASSAANNAGHQIYADASNYFSVTPGETVTVSAWMRHTSATNKSYVPRIQFWDRVPVSGAAAVGSTVAGTWVLGPGGMTTTWTLMSQTIDVPAGALGMAVYMDLANVGDPGWAVGDILDVTCLLIESGPLLNDYFDGTSTDTATTQFDWSDAANSSTSRQVGLIDWQSRSPITRNPLSFWDSGAWQELSPAGITGPSGPTGPDGSAVRTSSGGCRFRGSQTAQPTGAIWDADNFIVDSMSTDPNPCMGLVSSNDMSVLRNTSSLIITATVAITNTQISSRSYVAITLAPSGVILGRTSITQTTDTVTLTVIAQLTLGDKVRVQTYLNTAATPIAYTCYVMAALAP